MKTRNTYFYILCGIIFGFLYSLIPMYINVIFTQKIVEYIVDMRLADLIILCLFSAIAIIIAELLNSIYENIIKPQLKIKIQSDVISNYLKLLENMDLRTINIENNYNNLKLIENKSFEQRIDLFDNIIGIVLQTSVLISLITFLMAQNAIVTFGVIVYAVIINMVSKKLNVKKLDFQAQMQTFYTEKEILTNYYLLPEYSEYIRDDSINRQAISSFKKTCSNLIKENKNFLKHIFIINTLCVGGSNIVMEYISLIILGYIKIKKNLITTAQFLSYYRATDILISGMDFLLSNINKLHLNYIFLKRERMQIKNDSYHKLNNFATLEMQNVCLKIDNKNILRNVFIKIKKGDKIAVIGHNASGKTTLLKIIADMINITSGEVKLNGKHDPCVRQSACYVPANTVFFQWEKIDSQFFRNFTFNSEYDNADRIVRKVRTFLKHKMLSEGEKKILMIMHAFSLKCDLIVLDEPFANLDEKWKNIIGDLIYSSARTVVLSTHDALRLNQCTSIYEIKNGKCNTVRG